MLGVAIGVAVLIVVLSVMNGFERELRSRILSVTSHATVSAFGAGMADWPAARRLALGNPRVRGAAPFVEGEALLIGDKIGAGSAAASVRGVLLSSRASVGGRRAAQLRRNERAASGNLPHHPRCGLAASSSGARPTRWCWRSRRGV